MTDELNISRKEARRKERQELYQSKRWKECREYMMKTHPLCQDCLKEGRIVPAEEVHHIRSPFAPGLTEEEKYRRAFEVANLVCLCKECHIKRHHKDELTIQDKLKIYAD